MADINDDLAAKIDERRRKLDQVDRAIADMRRLQQEIGPLLRSPTERLSVAFQIHKNGRW